MTVTRAQIEELAEGDMVGLIDYGPHAVTMTGPVTRLDGALWMGDVVRLEMRDGDVPVFVARAELTVLHRSTPVAG